MINLSAHGAAHILIRFTGDYYCVFGPSQMKNHIPHFIQAAPGLQTGVRFIDFSFDCFAGIGFNGQVDSVFIV